MNSPNGALYVFPPATIPSLSIAGSDRRFPIHRVYCVGRNYLEHAREMGAESVATPGQPASEAAPARPMFFSKPADAVCELDRIPYPPATQALEHEVELVVALGEGGTDIAPADALDHVFGYGVGVDLTRRDMQRSAKEKRHPWDMAKGFDFSAPCSPIRPVSDIGHPVRGEIALRLNGELRQQADLSEQIWSVPKIVAALSTLVRLAPGDLLFTGTPAGVGPVLPGDAIDAWIDGVEEMRVEIDRA